MVSNKTIFKEYHYIQKGEATDDLTKIISDAVTVARKNEVWKSEYMKELLHDDDIMEEGIAIGEERGMESTILSLYMEGLITKEIAAERLKIDTVELDEKVKDKCDK